ncbi:MAG: molybdate ABC transporter permease subunit [Methylococcales bacterium]|nr:molybdate ABC transporter permease subunit [Methylococcales bacterium]
MDWQALFLSIKLSTLTVAFLLPTGIYFGRLLAYKQFSGKSVIQALLAIPLILPPTVLGYYLLIGLGAESIPGIWLNTLFDRSFVFSFEGLLIASLLFNLPFAIQPCQRAFEAIPREIREAASCCGMPPFKVLWRIELPLAWTGIVTAMVMTFAHTLGEFGVVLMVGGNIPGETRTIAIAIYDSVQAFDNNAAAIMSASLLAFSIITITVTYIISDKNKLHHG